MGTAGNFGHRTRGRPPWRCGPRGLHFGCPQDYELHFLADGDVPYIKIGQQNEPDPMVPTFLAAVAAFGRKWPPKFARPTPKN